MNEYTVYLIKNESVDEDSSYFEIFADYYEFHNEGEESWIVFYKFTKSIEPTIVFMIKTKYVLCVELDKEGEEESGE